MQQEMTNTPGVIHVQPMPSMPWRAGMMQHFLIKCSTILSRDFLHASDILFCKFCCRCLSSNNHNGYASLQTTKVRHTPVSEMLKCEKMCSTESMKYTLCLLFPFCFHQPPFFTKTLILPIAVSLTISGQNYWGSQGITGFAPSVYRGSEGLGKDPWCDLKECFGNPNLPQPRPPFLCHKEARPLYKGLGMLGQWWGLLGAGRTWALKRTC